VAISQTCAPSKKSASRIGVADKPASDACFNDWKRFCFVLREIASGENGRPLPGFEAQMRAQGVLVECGYTWPGRAEVHKPIVGHAAAPGDHNAKAPVEPHLASAGAKLKSAGEVQSRSDLHPQARTVASGGPAQVALHPRTVRFRPSVIAPI
jgi:hypothetical protein